MEEGKIKVVWRQSKDDSLTSRNPYSITHTAKTKYQKSKQIFPEKELRGHRPNFHILVCVSDLYILRIGLPFLLQENMWTDPGNTVYKSLKEHMNVEIWTEATQFHFWEYTNGVFVAVHALLLFMHPLKW
jgi:hypothetical protein